MMHGYTNIKFVWLSRVCTQIFVTLKGEIFTMSVAVSLKHIDTRIVQESIRICYELTRHLYMFFSPI